MSAISPGAFHTVPISSEIFIGALIESDKILTAKIVM